MELSKRLQAIADYVCEAHCVADIGTDHGYIPIYLVKNQKVQQALAMDVNQGPLNKAIKHVAKEGLSDKITCIRSDGLCLLPREGVDTIVIAGMGGDLMEQILQNGADKLKNIKQLVLSPQSHPEKVRHLLHQLGYEITRENMIKEDGKYYLILDARKGKEAFVSETFYTYGKYLLEHHNMVLKEYLDKEEQSLHKILEALKEKQQESIVIRRKELYDQLEQLKGALSYYEIK